MCRISPPSRSTPMSVSSRPEIRTVSSSPSRPKRVTVADTRTINAPAGPPICHRLPPGADTKKPPIMVIGETSGVRVPFDFQEASRAERAIGFSNFSLGDPSLSNTASRRIDHAKICLHFVAALALFVSVLPVSSQSVRFPHNPSGLDPVVSLSTMAVAVGAAASVKN